MRRRDLSFDDDLENTPVKNSMPVCIHPHEGSKDYLLRAYERGGNRRTGRWEDCRIVTKFEVIQVSEIKRFMQVSEGIWGS